MKSEIQVKAQVRVLDRHLDHVHDQRARERLGAMRHALRYVLGHNVTAPAKEAQLEAVRGTPDGA